MDEIKLSLLPQEAVDIANTLGQLPTQSNAYPLFMKVKGQIEQQMAERQKAEEQKPAE